MGPGLRGGAPAPGRSSSRSRWAEPSGHGHWVCRHRRRRHGVSVPPTGLGAGAVTVNERQRCSVGGGAAHVGGWEGGLGPLGQLGPVEGLVEFWQSSLGSLGVCKNPGQEESLGWGRSRGAERGARWNLL